MKEIVQRENFAIGNEKLLNSLSTMESVRILLISDSHGGRIILREIFQEFGNLTDIFCFCGDGIPDLVDCIEQSHWDKELSSCIPNAMFFVQGNGDSSRAMILTDERCSISVPVEVFFEAAGKKIYMTHGHKFDVYYGTKDLYKNALSLGADIVFYGHTHIANAQVRHHQIKDGEKKAVTLLNPGSCSIPRGGMPHTFAIVTISKNKKDVDYTYYEIQQDENGDYIFAPYTPPEKEISLFW